VDDIIELIEENYRVDEKHRFTNGFGCGRAFARRAGDSATRMDPATSACSRCVLRLNTAAERFLDARRMPRLI
jgi:hypothetical protein